MQLTINRVFCQKHVLSSKMLKNTNMSIKLIKHVLERKHVFFAKTCFLRYNTFLSKKRVITQKHVFWCYNTFCQKTRYNTKNTLSCENTLLCTNKPIKPNKLNKLKTAIPVGKPVFSLPTRLISLCARQNRVFCQKTCFLSIPGGPKVTFFTFLRFLRFLHFGRLDWKSTWFFLRFWHFFNPTRKLTFWQKKRVFDYTPPPLSIFILELVE